MEERGCCTIVQHRAFVELLVAQQPRCGILAAVVAATLHEGIRILVTLPLLQCRSLVVWLLKSWSFSTVRLKSDGLKTLVISIVPSTWNPSINRLGRVVSGHRRTYTRAVMSAT